MLQENAMSNRTIAAKSCQLLMAICAAVEFMTTFGIAWSLLASTKFWPFAVLSALALLNLLTALLFKIQPVWSVISGVLLLAASTVLLWPDHDLDHDFEGLLMQHSLEVAYLAAGLAGYLVLRSSKRLKT